MCKQCFKRTYEKYGDSYILSSELVTTDDGSRRRRNDSYECVDFTTGDKFFTRERIVVKGHGHIPRDTHKSMFESGEIVETRDGYLLKEDLRLDTNFEKYYAGNEKSYIFKCGQCKKDFIARNPTCIDNGYLCNPCAVGHGVNCQNCGSTYKDNELMGKLISLGMETRVHGFCVNCITASLPFTYHSHAKLEGLGRTAGIEVECDPTVQSQIDLALWGDKEHMVTGITDGSLRGKYQCEFVSPILRESNYEWWLSELGKRLRAGVYIRCGLHIHVGTTNDKGERYSWYEMNNLMRYLKLYEGFFFSIVSPSRRIPDVLNGNNAGLPVTLPDIPKFSNRETLLDWCYGPERTLKDVGRKIHETKRCNDRNVHYNGHLNRYQWANFHGHWFKGAIEIRLHQGTANVEKMRNWMEAWFNWIPHAAQDDSKWQHPMKVLPKHLELYYLERIKKFKKLAAFKPHRLDQ